MGEIILQIKAKCKYLIEKYFSDNLKIENYLKNANCNKKPQEILNKLTNLSNLIHDNNNVDDDILIQIFDMLINKNNNLTFYEIEKSGIVYNLTKYLDGNFTSNLEKNEKFVKYSNHEFLKKIKKFFHILDLKNKNINDFISLLQYSISSMNCFKIQLFDFEYKGNSHLTCKIIFFNLSFKTIKNKN